MSRSKALVIHLTGTMGQIIVTCIVVSLLRSAGMELNYSTIPGVIAIGIGGISSALWGVIISISYKKTTVKNIFLDFINVKQTFSSYLLVCVFLMLDFGAVLVGGKFQINNIYMLAGIFLKAIIFGGIEEVGWRYTFQPILEEKVSYICSTIITFLSWGIWHFLYFYIDGSLFQIRPVEFLFGLLTSCFILSTLYNTTNSLWICVMTHALINTFSQTTTGGSEGAAFACKVVIICFSIMMCKVKEKQNGVT